MQLTIPQVLLFLSENIKVHIRITAVPLMRLVYAPKNKRSINNMSIFALEATTSAGSIFYMIKEEETIYSTLHCLSVIEYGCFQFQLSERVGSVVSTNTSTQTS